MKRSITSIFVALLLVVTAMFFVSCKDDKDDEVLPVAIDLTNAVVAERTTLLEVMEDLKAQKALTFEIADGMITSINGTANASTFNSCWMLYTSDDDPAASNSAWGTYEYKGQTLASAALGAESLVVKSGEIYVWVYTTF